MKILFAVFAFFLCFAAAEAESRTNINENAVAERIGHIIDPQLREHVLKLWRLSSTYTNGAARDARSKEIINEIYRASYSVCISFQGGIAVSPPDVSEVSRDIIEGVYIIVFRRLSWIDMKKDEEHFRKTLETMRNHGRHMGLTIKDPPLG